MSNYGFAFSLIGAGFMVTWASFLAARRDPSPADYTSLAFAAVDVFLGIGWLAASDGSLGDRCHMVPARRLERVGVVAQEARQE